jgi:hypothetical protein
MVWAINSEAQGREWRVEVGDSHDGAPRRRTPAEALSCGLGDGESMESMEVMVLPGLRWWRRRRNGSKRCGHGGERRWRTAGGEMAAKAAKATARMAERKKGNGSGSDSDNRDGDDRDDDHDGDDRDGR